MANSAIRICIESTARPAASSRPQSSWLREAVVITICALTSVAALAWLYLLTLHGGFWLTGYRLPPAAPAAGPAVGRGTSPRPVVAAVIPARNEAGILPASLPSRLGQDYDGLVRVVLVDDDSTDETAKVAREIAAEIAGPELVVVSARPTPPGWAGKVWAMAEGVAAADAEYILFTDADIALRPGVLTDLVRAATAGQYALVSQMARLRTATRWEKVLVPAFVYFFAQLYPFSRVNRERSRTAAAAGGCMLVRTSALAAAGGLAGIKGARIDDVALGTLLKRAGGRCWLGLTESVVSVRPYDHLADIWNMVARSAYTELNYSPVNAVGVVLAMAWLYLLLPVAGIVGLILLATGAGSATVAWLTAAGLAGWLFMSVTYAPMLRLYKLSALRAPSLPLVAGMYAAMVVDSARRHHRGHGGEWKGRVIPPQPD